MCSKRRESCGGIFVSAGPRREVVSYDPFERREPHLYLKLAGPSVRNRLSLVLARGDEGPKVDRPVDLLYIDTAHEGADTIREYPQSTNAERAVDRADSPVIIHAVNAAERFFAASRARDVDAAAAELAPDVIMLNPATDDPVIGKVAVVAALHAVEAACDAFSHTHLLVEKDTDRTPLFGLVFEAKVGEATLRGVDLIELDEADRISSFTVVVRPVGALMALGARMSAPLQQ